MVSEVRELIRKIFSEAKEKIGKIIFTTAAIICVIAVVAIFVFMFAESIPAFKKIGVFNFIFGDTWAPDRLDSYSDAELSGSYGVFKMIVGTLASTAGALAIGGTLGYFTAIFLAFYCPQKLKKFYRTTINLLAGIPSVVYGFFGIVFLLPTLSLIAPNNGSGLLATSIILGIMITPTVVSLSFTSIEAVPSYYYEGALALGENKSQAVFGTVVKAARSGITASLVLGIGRALGETMAVVMVAGNSVAYPSSLFNSFRVLTANIVMEMGYAGEVQHGALIATGVVLLFFVLAVNTVFGKITKKAVESSLAGNNAGSDKRKKNDRKNSIPIFSRIIIKLSDFSYALKYKTNTAKTGAIAAVCAGIITGLSLVSVITFILVKGFPYLVSNPYLIFGKYEFDSEKITVLPSIITTVMTVLLSLAISVPIGVFTAIYLNEYSRRDSWIIKIIRGAIDLLNGVPSIVYGLFGMIVFVPYIVGTSSILAGTLTVSTMLLPTIVRSTEESLKSVASGLREGSLALGAGKMRTVFRIVLPSALPGIVSAVILSAGRVISESAPFIYTMGSVISAVPKSYLDSNATLAVALYRLSGEGWYLNEAYATAVILIVIVLAINLITQSITDKLNRKNKGVS